MRGVALVLLIGLVATSASADQYLKSTSPKSSIDSFMRLCRQEMRSDSFCRCQVGNLVKTPDGDFLVDAVAAGGRMTNIQKSVGTERARTLLDRHALTREEAMTILDGADRVFRSAGNGCG